jgi:hypothetical protein
MLLSRLSHFAQSPHPLMTIRNLGPSQRSVLTAAAASAAAGGARVTLPKTDQEMYRQFGRSWIHYASFLKYLRALNVVCWIYGTIVVIAQVLGENQKSSPVHTLTLMYLQPQQTQNPHVWFVLQSVPALFLMAMIVWYLKSLKQTRADFNDYLPSAQHPQQGSVVTGEPMSPGSPGQGTPNHQHQRQRRPSIAKTDDEMYDVLSPHLYLQRRSRSACLVWCGRLLSLMLFVALMVSYWWCQWEIQNWSTTIGNQVTGQTVVSLSFVTIDLLWKAACGLLTYLESHTNYSLERKSDGFKSLVFRIASFEIFMWIHNHTTGYDAQQVAASTQGCTIVSARNGAECAVWLRTQQMLNLLVVDLTVGCLGELFTTWIYNRFCACICCERSSRRSANEFRANFDFAAEYVKVLYRQFLITQTLSISPVAALLGVIAAVVEVRADKWKLLNMCGWPTRSHHDYREIIVVGLVLNVVAFFVAYPNGKVWNSM